jgi:hypothetical protein
MEFSRSWTLVSGNRFEQKKLPLRTKNCRFEQKKTAASNKKKTAASNKKNNCRFEQKTAALPLLTKKKCRF